MLLLKKGVRGVSKIQTSSRLQSLAPPRVGLRLTSDRFHFHGFLSEDDRDTIPYDSSPVYEIVVDASF